MSFTNERNTVESAVRETVVFDEDQNDGLYPGLSRPGLSLRQSLSRPLSASRARLINETPEKRAERLARMRAYSKRRREMKKQGDGNSGDLDLNSSKVVRLILGQNDLCEMIVFRTYFFS